MEITELLGEKGKKIGTLYHCEYITVHYSHAFGLKEGCGNNKDEGYY